MFHKCITCLHTISAASKTIKQLDVVLFIKSKQKTAPKDQSNENQTNENQSNGG